MKAALLTPIDGIVARYVIFDALALCLFVAVYSMPAYQELQMNHFNMGAW